MNPSESSSLIVRGWAVIFGIVLVAALYLGRELFLPLVLAGLFSFLLAPVVNRLERWRFRRVPAVLVTTALAFAVIGAIAYLVAGQLIDLAYQLPSYKENIRAKILSFHVPTEGPWGNLTATFNELRKEATKKEADLSAGESAARAVGENETKAVPVKIVKPGGNAGDMAQRAAAPVLRPLGSAFVIIVIAIFMLIKKEDLRNRVILLAGRNRLSLTTRTLEDAGSRVGRYLFMQFVVNVIYGILIATGLACIGVPNAVLWGLLAGVLRFVPYIGPWIGAFFPLMLSLAVSASWTMPLLTFCLFLGVELICANVVEPWLYGSSAGISPVAVIVAAVFWTSLWGIVGLLLSTPLTVCLAVLGKHIPALSFLDTVLGEEPALPLADRYYQRLLARDEVEAATVLADYEKKTSFQSVLADLLGPAVMSGEKDFEAKNLEPDIFEFVLKTVRKHAVRRTTPHEDGSAPPDVLVIPAEDEGDEVMGVVLAELLGPAVHVRVASWQTLTHEKTEAALASGAQVICISDTSRHDAPRARFLGRRLRLRQCSAVIVAGLWSFDEETSNLAALAERFSADQAVTHLLAARDALHGWIVQQPALSAVAVAA